MKRFTMFFAFVALALFVVACAPAIRYEGTIDLTGKRTIAGQPPSNIKEAIERQKALITKRSSYARPEWYARLAYLYTKSGQYDEAIAAAKRAIELKPIASAYHNLGYAYQRKGQYEEALAAYERALQIEKDPVTYQQVGRVYLILRNYSAAAKNFKIATGLDKDNGVYLTLLSLAYYRMGNYNEALMAIDRAIELTNHGNIGMKLKISKVFDIVNAREVKVVEVDKGGPADKAGIKVGSTLTFKDINVNDFKVPFEQIVQYLNNLKPGTEIEVWAVAPGAFQFPQKKILKVGRVRDPDHALKLGMKAEILARLGRISEAKKYAEKSLSNNASNKISRGWAKVALARIEIEEGNYAEVSKILSGENTPKDQILKAIALARMGELDRAKSVYLAIPENELTPKKMPLWSDRAVLLHELAPIVLKHESKANQLIDQGFYKQALEEYSRAIRLAHDEEAARIRKKMFQLLHKMPTLPRMPEAAHRCVVRGEAFIEEGEFKRAASEFRKAIKLAPYIPKLYFNTALVEAKAGNYTGAINHMKTYLMLAPEAPNARAAKDQIYKWEVKMERQSEE